jgi:hypothetical protein
LTQARDSYGVVVARETLSVDERATEELRAELRGSRGAGEWEAPRSYFRNWPLTTEQLNEIKAASVSGVMRLEA